MQTTTLTRVAAALALAAGPAPAFAAGFQLLEQNASGIANAYAGSAAVAEDASTIFFNPAGMTALRERELSVGLAAVRPRFEFSDRGSTATGALGGDGGDAGSWAYLPNAYVSWALRPDLYVGVGLGAPFGLITEYDDNWVGAAHSVSFDIKTYNINPSIAWRINERVSVGGGLSWQRMEVEYERVAAVLPAPLPLSSTRAILDADSDAWGWNVGALITLSPATRLGLSYRSAIKHTLEGDLKVKGAAAGLSPALSSGKAKADVELPDTFILSAVHRLDERWELLGDISWTGWSKIDKVDIVRDSGPLSGVTVQTLDTDFRDTWRVALGAGYRLNAAWKLKAGLAWDQSPVKDRAHRLVSLPDNDRTWFAAGAQWMPGGGARVDLGLAYLYVPKTKIDNDQAALGRGRVTGEYDSSVWILGAQYSVAF
ncbi:OmpP1/FadL family transporter [Azoarcus olearius]|uniref:Probable long-chain fatty acid transport protein n=1 Tax=Azoarcus sp. (strain BH72) TaxID=418699 RepID=A1K2M9_AZOSB|nr:outer membrane protein transport protein [Azoarcus olearius]CAL93084.1 probable long-chain fatty acid transport protein [Azoarcus olearius]